MESKKFCIRDATAADAPLILQFIRDLAEYEHMLDEVVATEDVLREWIFEKKRAEVIIGEEAGQAVGFALYFYNFSTFLGRAGIYVEDVFVKPVARGKGYGKALFQRLAAKAAGQGCGRMEWACLTWNEPSIGFYLSLGAEPMDEWTVYRLSGEKLAKLAEKA